MKAKTTDSEVDKPVPKLNVEDAIRRNNLNIDAIDSDSDYDSGTNDDSGINQSDDEENEENSSPKSNQLSQSQKSSECVEDIAKELKDISISEKGPVRDKGCSRPSPIQRPEDPVNRSSNHETQQPTTSYQNNNIQPHTINNNYQINTRSEAQNIPWNNDYNQQYPTSSTDLQNSSLTLNNIGTVSNYNELYPDSFFERFLQQLPLPSDATINPYLKSELHVQQLPPSNSEFAPEFQEALQLLLETDIPNDTCNSVVQELKNNANYDNLLQYNDVSTSPNNANSQYKSNDLTSEQSPIQNISYPNYDSMHNIPKSVSEIKTKSLDCFLTCSQTHNHVINNGNKYSVLKTPSTIKTNHSASNTTTSNRMASSSQSINQQINVCRENTDYGSITKKYEKRNENDVQTLLPREQRLMQQNISSTIPNKTHKTEYSNGNINNATSLHNSSDEHIIQRVPNFECYNVSPASTSRSSRLSTSSVESHGSFRSVHDLASPISTDPEEELKDICARNDTINQKYWSSYGVWEYEDYLGDENNKFNEIQRILTSNDPHYLIRLRQAILRLTESLQENESKKNCDTDVLRVFQDNGGVLQYAERLLDHNKLAYRYLNKVISKYNHYK